MWFPQFSTEAHLWMFWLPSSCLYFLKTQNLLLEKYFSTCVALMPLSVKVFRQLQPRGGCVTQTWPSRLPLGLPSRGESSTDRKQWNMFTPRMGPDPEG